MLENCGTTAEITPDTFVARASMPRFTPSHGEQHETPVMAGQRHCDTPKAWGGRPVRQQVSSRESALSRHDERTRTRRRRFPRPGPAPGSAMSETQFGLQRNKFLSRNVVQWGVPYAGALPAAIQYWCKWLAWEKIQSGASIVPASKPHASCVDMSSCWLRLVRGEWQKWKINSIVAARCNRQVAKSNRRGTKPRKQESDLHYRNTSILLRMFNLCVKVTTVRCKRKPKREGQVYGLK